MKKILIFLVAICLLSTSLVSCGRDDEGEVSVFYYTYSDTYISGVRSAVDKMLKNAGLKFNNYDKSEAKRS